MCAEGVQSGVGDGGRDGKIDEGSDLNPALRVCELETGELARLLRAGIWETVIHLQKTADIYFKQVGKRKRRS